MAEEKIIDLMQGNVYPLKLTYKLFLQDFSEGTSG